jgi:hypothetical protein
VDEALLAAGRLANQHGQAVSFGKIHVFHNAMQAGTRAVQVAKKSGHTHLSSHRSKVNDAACIVTRALRRLGLPLDLAAVVLRYFASKRREVA